jgi:hypothetical protein
VDCQAGAVGYCLAICRTKAQRSYDGDLRRTGLNIVAGDEPAQSAEVVEHCEFFTASTSAQHQSIRFPGKPKPVISVLAMFGPVFRNPGNDLKIGGIVVRFVVVYVVDDLTFGQSSPDLLLGHDSVLIGIAAYVGEMVFLAHPDEHITVRRQYASALPTVIVTAYADTPLHHASSAVSLFAATPSTTSTGPQT